MWKWPWPCRQRHLARLDGYQRTPCLASVVYRGTPKEPGLGLGLVRGDHCIGIAFEVDAADWPRVSGEIDERELVTGVYERVELPVRLQGPDNVVVPARTFVARPDHPQFLHAPSEGELVRRIAFARGTAGTCLAYWQETLSAMQSLDIEDPSLARLVAMANSLSRTPSERDSATS